MKKQLISALALATMLAMTGTNVFAKDDFASAQSVNVKEATTISKETIYKFSLTTPSFVVFNMEQADKTADCSAIAVYNKANRDGSFSITGDHMKSAAILPAGDYYFESQGNIKTDELTITTTDLNSVPTLKSGKTYKGMMNAEDYLVYKYSS